MPEVFRREESRYTRIMDIIVRIILISFLLTLLHNVLSGAIPAITAGTPYMPHLNDLEVVIQVHTDDFPNETSWSIEVGNTFEIIYTSDSLELTPQSLFLDTIQAPAGACLRFTLKDASNDGFGPGGYVKVEFEGSQLFYDSVFSDILTIPINCGEGLVCEKGIPLRDGSELLKQGPTTWFLIEPEEDTYYDMRTIGSCDTELWIYDKCQNINPHDQTGAILYNDDFDGTQAGFNQILLTKENSYFVRVGVKEECHEEIFFYLVDLKLKKGCLDPTACNFDPLANHDGQNCVFGNCQPDLRINSEIFQSSIYLDSIYYDSECLIPEGCLQGYGLRHIIRFSTQIDNIGNADYIVGSPEENSHLFSKDNCHQHWHYLGYAEYLLFDGNGASRPVGFKNGFCALDYRCDQHSSYKYDCNYMGISAGCFDIYESDLLCQWVDVTDVPDGIYTLVNRVNYKKFSDAFGRIESNFENNWSQVCVRLDRSSGNLKLEIIHDCPSYTDCMGVQFGGANIDCNGVCGGSAHYGDMNEDGRLDELDLLEFELKIQDDLLNTETCYDLDGDSLLTLADLLLAEDCILNNTYLENDPLHRHCEFPIAIDNPKDTIELSMLLNPENTEELIFYYKSNTSIRGLDFRITGVEIQSAQSVSNEHRAKLLNSKSRMVLYYNQAGAVLPKTSNFTLFLKARFLKLEEEVCLRDIYHAANELNEKIQVVWEHQCLDLRTTTVSTVKNTEVRVFPNPAGASLNVIGNEDLTDKKLIVYDLKGREMQVDLDYPGGYLKVGVSALNYGVYFLKIWTESGPVQKRFIKIQ